MPDPDATLPVAPDHRSRRIHAVGQIVHARRGHAEAPGDGLQRAAGEGDGVAVRQRPALLPGKETLLRGRIALAVVPAARALPVVAIEHEPGPEPPGAPGVIDAPGDEARVGFGFETVNHVGAGLAQARQEALGELGVGEQGASRGQGDVVDEHALFLPGVPAILRTAPGREQQLDLVAARDERLGQRQRPHRHRPLGPQPKGADHGDPHPVSLELEQRFQRPRWGHADAQLLG